MAQIPTCQIDASWINNGSVSGLGWSLKDQMGIELFGLPKDARTRGYLFTHIDQTQIDGSALRRIGSFTIHLI
ncbi:hypothetical protein IGI04_002145 [Brassica rapa subsp. trilocularis]|uniref:Uncharacterized protein n=1 Tax=Brassica rapa subsp. trilocularis TaxID=1813537 RepID=A0ABQ7NUQ1_BRACM|nr:hypothetical protein IGI04_002145 [Brassica rapa subsp. trilocularis]